jgi:hypothetical protein
MAKVSGFTVHMERRGEEKNMLLNRPAGRPNSISFLELIGTRRAVLVCSRWRHAYMHAAEKLL